MSNINFYLILSGSIFLGYIFSYYLIKYLINEIKYRYRKFDEEETMKEDIRNEIKKIKAFKLYIRDTYQQEVFRDISTKIDFALDLLSHRKIIKERYDLTKELYAQCYETGIRLRQKFDDVQYICSPLSNFSEKLVYHVIDYIKEHTQDGNYI